MARTRVGPCTMVASCSAACPPLPMRTAAAATAAAARSGALLRHAVLSMPSPSPATSYSSLSRCVCVIFAWFSCVSHIQKGTSSERGIRRSSALILLAARAHFSMPTSTAAAAAACRVLCTMPVATCRALPLMLCRHGNCDMYVSHLKCDRV